ncbi:amidase [Fusarium sporotrichioides]|uniref:Amidase n=1 Tax=Fusarium sporotrichioides TaxID=5514 RepID=A0A395SRW1_FUSSP|nr:amidase [Fusarium sporotrichioides]
MSMPTETYKLTATEVIAKIRDGQLTVEEYAESLLVRIKERDPIVKGWAYLNPDQVLYEARKLDQIPKESRGPLHGVAVAVKDVIYTKDMPTQFNSPIYEGDAPQVDAASVIILRKAGALIFGKTTTTEFAATTQGPATTNPHDSSRTPGGSSSGSGAVVGDFQVPIALGTQTGGSTIRPASFNGIYGFKPTWNSISREGQKMFSIINDTLGLYARSVADLNLLADVFALEDDQPPNPNVLLKGLRIGICKTMVWPQAGYGLVNAMIKAIELLRSNGAIVTEIEFPEHLQDLPDWYSTIFNSDGRTAFLPEYRLDKNRIADQLVGHVENRMKISRAAQLKAFDNIAAARPVVDDMLSQFDAVLTPSVPDEAPEGIESTGSAAFCQIWTADSAIVAELFTDNWKHDDKQAVINGIFKCKPEELALSSKMHAWKKYLAVTGTSVESAKWHFHCTSRKCNFDESISDSRLLQCDDADTCAFCSILRESLSMEYASEGGWFGAGIYSSNISSKADKFSHDPLGNYHTGLHAVIVCRVIVGRVQWTKKKLFGLKRPKPGFHSVQAVTKKRGGPVFFPETVVFRDEAILPVAVITYDKTQWNRNGQILY